MLLVLRVGTAIVSVNEFRIPQGNAWEGRYLLAFANMFIESHISLDLPDVGIPRVSTVRIVDGIFGWIESNKSRVANSFSHVANQMDEVE